MAFFQTSTGNTDKLSLFLECLEVFRAAVAHTGTQTADQLENRIRCRAFIRYTPLNTLGHKLACILLEITVAPAAVHRTERAHATINFKTATLIHFKFTRRLIAAREQGTEHNNIRTGGNRLWYIA